MSEKKFRKYILEFGTAHGRQGLPWRATKNPYHILVSEIMLQQTQVDRVIPKYRAFIKQFPTMRALSTASLRDVLSVWQGLGYNRRAKMLHNTAREIQNTYGGRIPKNAQELKKLPGIGDYTASAICAFAYNQDVVLIETNIRTVIIHHFFTAQGSVSDKEIKEVLTRLLPSGKASAWYAALMDYGAVLKKEGSKAHVHAKVYRPQSRFKGSAREIRGAIIRALLKESQTAHSLKKQFNKTRHKDVDTQILALLREGLVTRDRHRLGLF